MILVLACHCAGALPKARKFLQNNYVKNWIDVPVYIGKESSLNLISKFSEDTNAYPSIDALRNLVRNVSRFIIIIGYDDERMEWADIAHKDSKSMADAERILEQFA